MTTTHLVRIAIRAAAAAGFGLLALPVLPAVALADGDLYGTIVTHDGTSYTGSIRWDRNENYWDDILNARKERQVTGKRVRQEVRIFGLQISKSGAAQWGRSELAIPFGELAAIDRVSRDKVRFELRNGDVLDGRTSSDIGSGMRGIEVRDDREGSVELDWDSVKRVEFRADPNPGRDGDRLYGTVETRKARFTGFIVWDRDESLIEDILDGEADGRKYKIPFERITAIEKVDDERSRVFLDEGRDVELEGTNDVNDENRGIAVVIPGVGEVEIDWDAFRRVDFSPAPPSPGYDTFDGGRPLRGTVKADDGRSWTGRVVWDDDEEYTWEALDGEMVDVDVAILFRNIASIRRRSDDAATVTLRDGSVYELSDSNDVDEDNRGIIVRTDGGDEVRLDWESFESLELEPGN